MSSFTNIVKKELRELMTKSTILPIIMMAVMFGLLGNAFGGIDEQVKAKPIIGLIDQDAGAVSDVVQGVFASASDVVYNGTSVNEGISVLKDRGGSALLVIPANFSENLLAGRQGPIEVYWILKGTGISDTIPSITVDGLISATNSAVSTYLIENNASLNASLVLAPTTLTQTTIFVDRQMPQITPTEIQSVMASQSAIIPIAIAMIIMMAGGTVISSMGLEKENKTLETLLTLPVSRSSVVAGKLVASAIVGLLMAGVYMVGFSYYVSSLSGSASIDLADYGLGLGLVDYLLIGVSLFASLMAALSLCMVIGAFADNYKSAQTLTMPVTILALIPMFIIMFKDFGTLPLAGQVFMFGIPFSHPMMAFRSLMFDDYGFVLAGIAYSAIFAVVMISVAVWLFKTDRLLTGRMGKKARAKHKANGLHVLLASVMNRGGKTQT